MFGYRRIGEVGIRNGRNGRNDYGWGGVKVGVLTSLTRARPGPWGGRGGDGLRDERDSFGQSPRVPIRCGDARHARATYRWHSRKLQGSDKASVFGQEQSGGNQVQVPGLHRMATSRDRKLHRADMPAMGVSSLSGWAFFGKISHTIREIFDLQIVLG